MPVHELSPAALAAELKGPAGSRPVVLDVRNPDEVRVASIPGSLHVPLNELPGRLDELREELDGKAVVVLCHHGVRSWHAAAFLSSVGLTATSLAGGIDRWAAEVDPTMRRY